MTYLCRALAFLALAILSLAPPASAHSLVVTTNFSGPTPEILAYNSGHFYPGSNTKDWWRYSGVNGARFFIPSTGFEPSLHVKTPRITNEVSFNARREAVRNDPLKSTFINWPGFTNRFEHEPMGGIVFGYALREVRNLQLQICAQISGSPAEFRITGTNDWSGQWKFWFHCYAQAFHLARQYEVQRFQYFNEPNHPNAKGLNAAQYLHRLQLASDAFQSAVADVNRLYHKSLKPIILAPVTAGSPDGFYPQWGRPLITKRHVNFLGQTNAQFSLLHKYDYHQYNSTPEQFGRTASNLNQLLIADMSPEPPLPLTVTEFNVHTAGTFHKMAETLDSPTIFPQLAAKTINLIDNSANELYLFKLSQTDWHLGVKKNGAHYVDNTNAPYNIGTITRAGEVWRLINKGFTANRQRLAIRSIASKAARGLPDLDVMAAFDPATQRYYLLSANGTNRSIDLQIDFSAWNIPAGNHVLIEEVSETCFGGVRSWQPLSAQIAFSEPQPPCSVWLITLCSKPESSIETVPIADFASVRDGKYKNIPYEPGSLLRVQNNSTNADHRAVTYLKFHLSSTNTADIQSAFLNLGVQTVNRAALAYAHLYAINESTSIFNPLSHERKDAGPQTTASRLTPAAWYTAPSLGKSISPGANYTNNFLTGIGDSSQLIGQLTATPQATEKLIDLTAYLKRHPGPDHTFLLLRPIGFAGDKPDDSALTIAANLQNSAASPSLKIVRTNHK